MVSIDSEFKGDAYQEQEEVYFNDGREIQLLHFVYAHPQLDSMRNNPNRVLEAIDEYARTRKYLMNVGPYKANIVVDLIKERKPETVVELGGYVGYSAIAFGAALREMGGKRYFSLEYSPEFAAVIASLVDLAGLSDIVKVIVGKSSDSIRRLHQDGTLTTIDLLFLDHIKPAYTPDLRLCEDLKLIKIGSVLAADNVVKPGNPPYLEYVRSSVKEKRAKLQVHAQPQTSGASHKPQLSDAATDQETIATGNPNLIYRSQFIEGWEPSGVKDAIEITRCVDIESS